MVAKTWMRTSSHYVTGATQRFTAVAEVKIEGQLPVIF